MKSVVEDTSVLTLTSAWIACLSCNQRAYQLYGWRPQTGYSPNLRRFLCKNGHNSYKAFTEKELEKLQIK